MSFIKRFKLSRKTESSESKEQDPRSTKVKKVSKITKSDKGESKKPNRDGKVQKRNSSKPFNKAKRAPQKNAKNKKPSSQPFLSEREDKSPKVGKFVKKVDPKGFRGLGLGEQLLNAIGDLGYESPTPIQKESISELCKGRDLLGCAQTGTGKTAAFALPTLEIISRLPQSERRKIRVLALTPTRELALQVAESFQNYGKYLPLRTAVVFGGVGIEPQKRKLESGVDVLVATPGRLWDLYQQGFLDLKHASILVLDEADRMLDMGFLPDVKRILKILPSQRQNLLFSATMPPDIDRLAKSILKDPVTVEVAPVSSTSASVEQFVYRINRKNKRDLLLHVLENPATFKVLVFTRTKAIANRITKHLQDHKITSAAIHGNKSQAARQRALDMFKDDKIRVLVASDLAARGLDVDDITHVINYDLPNIAETYVHRIGRTGRAAAKGEAISFCDGAEKPYLRDIEAVIKKKITVIEDHPFPFEDGIDEPIVQGRPGPKGGRRGRHDAKQSQMERNRRQSQRQRQR